MVSLLEYAGAGLMSGVGAGMAKQWEADRAERLKQVEMQFQEQRDERNRQFQAGQATQQNAAAIERMRIQDEMTARRDEERFARTSDAEVKKEDRQAFREAAKRESEREYKDATEGQINYDAEGGAYRIRGDKASRIKDAETGEPVSGLRASRYSGASGGMSENQRRLAYSQGLKAGAPADPYSEHDWGRTIDEWSALGVDPNEPGVRNVVVAGLKKNAEKQKLTGDAARQYVDDELRKYGLADTSTTTMQKGQQGAVDSRAQATAPADQGGKGDRGGAPQPRLESKPAGERQPPAGYPDAQWSDARQGWFVKRDGKYYPLIER